MTDGHSSDLSTRACGLGVRAAEASRRVRKRLASVERELAHVDDLVQHLAARKAALEEDEPAVQRQR